MNGSPHPASLTLQGNENLLQDQKAHVFHCRIERLQGYWWRGVGGKALGVNGLATSKMSSSSLKTKSNLWDEEKLSSKMYFLRVPRIY